MTDNEPFKIGEVVIAQKFENFPEYNGQECTVIGELEPRLLIHDDMTGEAGQWIYRVQFADGRCLGPRPHQLRRKPEPTVDKAVKREVEVS